MHATVRFSVTALVALALAAPVMAQDARRPTSGASSTGSSASPRGGSSSAGASSSSGGSGMSSSPRGGGSTAVRRPAASRPSRTPQSVRRPSGQAAGGATVPSYSRPRGDRSPRGQAVDRGNNPLPSRGNNGSYYYPYGYYGRYPGYYSPYYSPYAFGLYPIYNGFGFFYYDPFWGHGVRGYPAGGYYYDDDDDRDYNIGSIRLKVDPSHAEVFVDGLYRGVVDDFDGIFQRLKLEAGAHRLEVRAEGFEPLVFDVLVTPGETTTYRGDLKR